jgi:hypothetical protein
MQMMACIFVFTVRDFLSDYEYYMHDSQIGVLLLYALRN